jgi:protein archease
LIGSLKFGKKGGYRQLDHTADLMIEVVGRGREGLFVSVGEALTDILVGIERVGGEANDGFGTMEVTAGGETLEELFVDWLRELLYIFNVKGWIFSTFEIVELTKNSLKAVCGGERFDIERHGIKTEIKAATYHGLEIEIDDESGDCTAVIVFDV